MDLTDIIDNVGVFMKDLLRNKIGVILAFLCGLTPTLLIWFRSRRLWHRAGAVGEFDVDFQLIFLHQDDDVESLEVWSGGDTTLDDLYPNRHVRSMVVKGCSHRDHPFLDIPDAAAQRRLHNPLLKRASRYWGSVALVRALGAAPTMIRPFIFALTKISGGVQTQYRVLLVPEEQLAGIISEQDLKAKRVAPHFQFLMPILALMAKRYAEETSSPGGLRTLGRINLCCIDHSQYVKRLEEETPRMPAHVE